MSGLAHLAEAGFNLFVMKAAAQSLADSLSTRLNCRADSFSLGSLKIWLKAAPKESKISPKLSVVLLSFFGSLSSSVTANSLVLGLAQERFAQFGFQSVWRHSDDVVAGQNYRVSARGDRAAILAQNNCQCGFSRQRQRR